VVRVHGLGEVMVGRLVAVLYAVAVDSLMLLICRFDGEYAHLFSLSVSLAPFQSGLGTRYTCRYTSRYCGECASMYCGDDTRGCVVLSVFRVFREWSVVVNMLGGVVV